MIISHTHKFIFIKCRKTASTSLEIALSEICGPEDVITPIHPLDEAVRKKMGFRGTQNTHVPFKFYKLKDWGRLILKGRKKIFYNHMPAKEIREYVESEIWNTYFKFCVERNPFDKIISHYYWAGGNNKFGNLTTYLTQKGYEELVGFDMYHGNRKPLVDHIMRYENLEEEIHLLNQHLSNSKQIKLPSVKSKSSHRTDRRSYREVIADSERLQIEKLFQRELQFLGYSF